MMKQCSPEFIHGYLFSEIERKVIKDITDKTGLCFSLPNTFTAHVPLLWFGIKNHNYINPTVRVTLAALTEELCKKLDETLHDAFPKRLFHTVPIQEKQYYRFVTTVIEDRRRRTLSQIEDALGYKVTIVSEEDK